MSRVNKLKDPLRYEITGIALLAISVLTLLSVINPSIGLVGGVISSLLMRLAGEGRYLVPVFLTVFGLKMLLRKSKVKTPVNLSGALIIAVVVLTLLHFTVPAEYALKSGLAGDGGGLIGGLIYFLLLKSFGVSGMYIILTALLLIGLLLLTNQSISVLLKNALAKTFNMLKKTIQMVDEFLFTSDEDEPVNQPVIIDGYPTGDDLPGGSRGKKSEFGLDEKNQSGEQTDPPREEKKSNVIYYRPFLNAGARRDEATGEGGSGSAAGLNEHESGGGESCSVEYQLPPVSLLAKPVRSKMHKNNRDIADNVKKLEETLGNFGIKAKVTQVTRGPAITRYEIQPPPGVKVSRIVSLADDIALSMASPDVRIEAPIPGKAVVGIEVPNKEIATVYLRELVETAEFQQMRSHLAIALGKDIAGNPIVDDLARMPHLLIAGATGAGKSVCLNTILGSILYKATPRHVKFLIIDPKMVELSVYNDIPHLVSPVVTDPKKAATSLRWAVKEMEYRYELFARAGVRDLTRYNNLVQSTGKTPLPLLVIVIDELADLMMIAPAEVEDSICRLAQMARAAGIHLVVATQRPSVDIITGLIKANIPSRISFAVSSQIDSRTILDMGGAEKLLGRGDMLYYPVGATKPVRVQGAYLSDREVELLVQHWKKQSVPKYDESIGQEKTGESGGSDIEDEMLSQAVKIFVETGHASISLLQRRLHIGYARAARLIDIMEKKGYVGGYEGSKPRAVLITPEEYKNQFCDQLECQAGNDK
ncbi:DNA translocase FtsK [Desulfallas sp. Bu1-1]|jgi:S-DNA-T family DNA segregation ATPase FtsK/SpoIIIE|uniref:DNA translocase FtsK n=1 Tax=Desulfallas sp. Bu1-1 TaxID=2787620 RepID=UPI00189E32D2|nr:DNA translocase FtsK [Desulfallas sp. Bu1-1]MBF7083037.1 DNA translocase FtsK [Desulfallas sp. Bu1-1]